MIQKIFRIYSFIFSRKIFFKWNVFIYHLSLRGIGILNYNSMSESGESSFLKNFCKQIKQPIIFDIGANKGCYSQTIKSISNDAEIFMFEPHPITFQSLKKNFKQDNFHLFNLACGEKEGSVNLYDYADRNCSSHATLVKNVIEDIHQGQSKEYQIEMIALDQFITEHNIKHINLLKIDTEGYELNVLKGCQESIKAKKIDIIHFEFNEMNILSRTFFKDFTKVLTNYYFYRFLRDGLIRITLEIPLYNEIFAYQNILAIRKDTIFNAYQ